MEKIWILALLLFLATTFVVWRLFNGFYKKETSTKLRNTWGARLHYWHFIVMISGLTTTLIISALKYGDILTF